TGVDDLGTAGQQRRNFGAVLAGQELGHLRGDHLDIRLELLHGRFEVVPGIVAPGVVLVDAGDLGRPRLGFGDVHGRRHRVDGTGRAGTEDVLIVVVL